MSDLTPNAIGQRWVNPVYRIKPLVWQKQFVEGEFRGNTSFGIYSVSEFCSPSSTEVEVISIMRHKGKPERHLFDTLDEAKAWCEQDWQNRIIECLEVVDA